MPLPRGGPASGGIPWSDGFLRAARGRPTTPGWNGFRRTLRCRTEPTGSWKSFRSLKMTRRPAYTASHNADLSTVKREGGLLENPCDVRTPYYQTDRKSVV